MTEEQKLHARHLAVWVSYECGFAPPSDEQLHDGAWSWKTTWENFNTGIKKGRAAANTPGHRDSNYKLLKLCQERLDGGGHQTLTYLFHVSL